VRLLIWSWLIIDFLIRWVGLLGSARDVGLGRGDESLGSYFSLLLSIPFLDHESYTDSNGNR
jgi:hypothetical protein